VFDHRQRQKIFPLASVSRPALRPTQPPVQFVPWLLSPEVDRGWGVTLTNHLDLLSRSRMSRTYNTSPPWRLHGVAGLIYFTFYFLHLLSFEGSSPASCPCLIHGQPISNSFFFCLQLIIISSSLNIFSGVYFRPFYRYLKFS
jgi:hypothetical protein